MEQLLEQMTGLNQLLLVLSNHVARYILQTNQITPDNILTIQILNPANQNLMRKI
jgi:hypothetical protein